jgi:hypothetical protein
MGIVINMAYRDRVARIQKMYDMGAIGRMQQKMMLFDAFVEIFDRLPRKATTK